MASALTSPPRGHRPQAPVRWTPGLSWSRSKFRSRWPMHRNCCRCYSCPKVTILNHCTVPQGWTNPRSKRMTDKCFRKCVSKPGSSLDNSEQKCIAMCMDRYMDAWNIVSRAYNSRLQRERAKM